MRPLLLFPFVIGVLAENVIYYNNFSGKNLTEADIKEYQVVNSTFWCVGKYEPCNANDGRRMDQSCNNLHYPYRGPPRTPFVRDLPPLFGKDFTPIKTRRGAPMEPSRKVRTVALAEGNVPDPVFSSLLSHYMLIMVNNVASVHDTANYLIWKTYCCQPKGKTDPECAPMSIPIDDTVHQFSGLRCMNMTKPKTFQDEGCIFNNKTSPERINSASTFLDLSIVYGFTSEYRARKDGLLQEEVVDGTLWPASGTIEICRQNEGPNEVRCHKSTAMNGLVGTNVLSIIFWRLHNHIARQLKMVNPCWSDDKLFDTARDINIAMSVQIYYYELMPLFMGRNNLIHAGVIGTDGGFRYNLYNKYMEPRATVEYSYVLRWGHTIQPGTAKMYDAHGHYLKEIPTGNLTLRTGYYAVDDNLAGIVQGFFRQPSGKIDYIIDPKVVQVGLGRLQYAFDIAAADLIKGGLLGIGSYIQYRELCSGRKYRTFADLAYDMVPENIDIIKTIYKDVRDVPLIVGVWLEKPQPGGFAPKTLYCLKVKQMRRFMQYDRHWYEHPDRPNAFTLPQLLEIRKSTIARVFCDVGDRVTQIQPQAFLRIGLYNKVTSCARIRNIDYNAWRDPQCFEY